MIELVAKTLPLIEGVSLDEFSAYIARIGKVKDNPEKLTKFLIKHSHWSPFEHTYFTFKIYTNRAIGREILRHRSMTFQELSQRYEKILEFDKVEIRKQSEDNRQSSTEVFNPIVFDNNITASEAIDDVFAHIYRTYDALLKKGVARECARMILPEAAKTTMLVTGNIRSWIHFLALRDDERAQKEIQLIAKEIKDILVKEIPSIFKN